MTAHPSPTRLELFMTGELAPEESRSVVRHLLRGCSECGETTTHLWEVLVTGRQAAPAQPDEYDEVFERAWARATKTHDRMRKERELASQHCRELFDLAPRQQRLLVRNNPRFQTLAVCEAVIQASEGSVFDDAATACNLAELAHEITDVLDAGTYGSAAVADVRAHSWASFANALRVSSDYAGAESALRTARAYLEEGSGDPLQKAKYLTSLANLLTSKSRTEEALEIYAELETIYSRLGDRHMLGRVQLKKAYVFAKRRNSEKEIQFLAQAMKLLDPARDPRRQAIALHNLVMALIDAGRPDEAESHMGRLRELHEKQGGRLVLLRLRWLEGRLACAQGRFGAAEQLFSEVRDSFVQLEIGIDVAVVSLDLAEVRCGRGDFRGARTLLTEAIPILKALGVKTAAIAAVGFLQESMRLEAASKELIRQTADFVRRSHHDPSVRFRPAELTANGSD